MRFLAFIGGPHCCTAHEGKALPGAERGDLPLCRERAPLCVPSKLAVDIMIRNPHLLEPLSPGLAEKTPET